MNYLYNGVELPDINEVWTAELREQYPYAAIILIGRTARLFVLKSPGYLANRPELPKRVCIYGLNNGLCWQIYPLSDTTAGWEVYDWSPDYHEVSYDGRNNHVWCNYDLKQNGAVVFPASEPVPVSSFTPDPISMTMGWLVGRRIAGQRGKKIEVPDEPEQPTLPEIVTWANGTDEQIAAMVAALDAGAISIEDTGWAIGDERTVTLSAMEATGVSESHVEQTATLVLMDSQHYTLTEPTAGGDTKDHFVVGLKDCLTELGYMNSYGSDRSKGSWLESARRAWCNDVFRAAIPETLRCCFKQFKVVTAKEYNETTIIETDDYFALFAEKEVCGEQKYSVAAEAASLSQIVWYATTANRNKEPTGNPGESYYGWFLRSPYFEASSRFCNISSSGTATTTFAWDNCGLAPFGCI